MTSWMASCPPRGLIGWHTGAGGDNGSAKCGIAGKSQSVLMMIHPIIFTRTRMRARLSRSGHFPACFQALRSWGQFCCPEGLAATVDRRRWPCWRERCSGCYPTGWRTLCGNGLWSNAHCARASPTSWSHLYIYIYVERFGLAGGWPSRRSWHLRCDDGLDGPARTPSRAVSMWIRQPAEPVHPTDCATGAGQACGPCLPGRGTPSASSAQRSKSRLD
jgi:hypothetical protein